MLSHTDWLWTLILGTKLYQIGKNIQFFHPASTASSATFGFCRALLFRGIRGSARSAFVEWVKDTGS
ncbi:uncharacterized protein EURHEDRAFT_413779 [Aspergillus ruber CBS 135680]|uniref:Uncharacterized protein n=1 Tax=Aspergillus ruber (strain CBS 135680) TaxID=1388766 RepID=A0A017SAE6_ASPRC|nr:uncharacterized protein EURHEDRAFT_413779 [Aspergillus ruber CBS 135680]EYE93791.1 hypothetical protein EURHEDRAFT_413779 [Aspergillus ruber CBS 135680]